MGGNLMVVTLYSSSSCTSCRKARSWLVEHDIEFVERNIFKQPLSKEEIKGILRLTEEGTEEIISTRSKVFTDLKIKIDDLTLSALVDLIQANPAILKRPIMLDDRRLQVGYNEDEIRLFLPRHVRKEELFQAQLLDRMA